jgi:hypothetical protein
MIEVRRDTLARVDEVWAVLSDGWLYPAWVVGASTMRHVEPGWPQPGARLHHSVGVWPLLISDDTSVVSADPPHELVLQARGWPLGEARVELRLERLDDGCRITMREDATHGVGRYVPRLLRVASIAPRNAESLRRLALLAEDRAQAGSR